MFKLSHFPRVWFVHVYCDGSGRGVMCLSAIMVPPHNTLIGKLPGGCLGTFP